MRLLAAFALCSTLCVTACKSSGEKVGAPAAPPQTEQREKLRYELLDPTDHKFRVTYELAATTAGARTYVTPARGDTFVSEASAEDLFTGAKLDLGLVKGEVARANGYANATDDGSYFLVVLDRPVPAGGEVRLRLQVTYEDRVSYEFNADECAFQRLLAVRDISVVLPPRHVLVDVNQPARITRLADGRIELAYTKSGHAPVPLRVRARKLPEGVEVPPAPGASDAQSDAPPVSLSDKAPRAERLACELEDPARGELVWRHEYELEADASGECWEKLAGEVVRVRVIALDTGAELAQRTGGELEVAGERQTHIAFAPRAQDTAETRATAAAAEKVKPDEKPAENAPAELVRASPRVQIEARLRTRQLQALGADACLFTADARIEELTLPAGWTVLACSSPVAVRIAADGRMRLEFAPGGASARVVHAWKTPAQP